MDGSIYEDLSVLLIHLSGAEIFLLRFSSFKLFVFSLFHSLPFSFAISVYFSFKATANLKECNFWVHGDLPCFPILSFDTSLVSVEKKKKRKEIKN